MEVFDIGATATQMLTTAMQLMPTDACLINCVGAIATQALSFATI